MLKCIQITGLGTYIYIYICFFFASAKQKRGLNRLKVNRASTLHSQFEPRSELSARSHYVFTKEQLFRVSVTKNSCGTGSGIAELNADVEAKNKPRRVPFRLESGGGEKK